MVISRQWAYSFFLVFDQNSFYWKKLKRKTKNSDFILVIHFMVFLFEYICVIHIYTVRSARIFHKNADFSDFIDVSIKIVFSLSQNLGHQLVKWIRMPFHLQHSIYIKRICLRLMSASNRLFSRMLLMCAAQFYSAFAFEWK